MTEKEGILRMQRRAVSVEVDGKLRPTRTEHLWGEGYHLVDGYKLRDGMRAAIDEEG